MPTKVSTDAARFYLVGEGYCVRRRMGRKHPRWRVSVVRNRFLTAFTLTDAQLRSSAVEVGGVKEVRRFEAGCR